MKRKPTINDLKRKIERMRIRQIKRDALKKTKDLFGNIIK